MIQCGVIATLLYGHEGWQIIERRVVLDHTLFKRFELRRYKSSC